jgi:hypothetical protein
MTAVAVNALLRDASTNGASGRRPSMSASERVAIPLSNGEEVDHGQ